MAAFKLSAKAAETIEYLESVLKQTDHYTALVEQFAAAKTKGFEMYATQLARDLSQLRQKAMIKNQGFIADTAGQLSVMASRGGSPMMKGRMLRDGVAAFKSLLERTIKGVAVADENEQKEKAYLAAKEKKAEAEHVRARVLAEEARDAARRTGAVGAAAPRAGAPAAPRSPTAPKAGAPAAPRPGAPAATKPGAAGVPKPGAAAVAKPGAAAAPKPGAPAAPKLGAAAAPKPGAPTAPRPGQAAPAPGAAAPRSGSAAAPKPGGQPAPGVRPAPGTPRPGATPSLGPAIPPRPAAAPVPGPAPTPQPSGPTPAGQGSAAPNQSPAPAPVPKNGGEVMK